MTTVPSDVGPRAGVVRMPHAVGHRRPTRVDAVTGSYRHIGSGGGEGGVGSAGRRAAGCTAPRRTSRFDARARAYALATAAPWCAHRSISRAAPSGPMIVQAWAGSLPHRSHARTSTTFLAMITRLSDHGTHRLHSHRGHSRTLTSSLNRTDRGRSGWLNWAVSRVAAGAPGAEHERGHQVDEEIEVRQAERGEAGFDSQRVYLAEDVGGVAQYELVGQV